MARSQETLSVDSSWQELTNADVVGFAFQVLRGRVQIRRGTTVAPSPSDSGWTYAAGQGERVTSLDQIANGSGPRVWVRAANRSKATVLVDHA